MGSIGIISLTTRRNRRFFISAEHYPVVKVRPEQIGPRQADANIDRRPAIRWSVACHWGRTRIRGSIGGPPSGPGMSGCVSGGPELFDLRPSPARLVETRRLELLTLSLQRRRSAN
jgi:hypothetical protein